MGKIISLDAHRRGRGHVRKKAVGQSGNGGQFALILRAESHVDVVDAAPCPLSDVPYDPDLRWPARGHDEPSSLRAERPGGGLDRAHFGSRSDIDLDGARSDYEAALCRRLPSDMSATLDSWSCNGGRSEEELREIARQVMSEAVAEDLPKIVSYRTIEEHPVPTPWRRGKMTPGRAARRFLLAEDLGSRGYRLTEVLGQERSEDVSEVFDAEGSAAAARYIEELPDQDPWGPPSSRERVMMVDALRDSLMGRCSLSREERAHCLDEARALFRGALDEPIDSGRRRGLDLAATLRASQATSGIRELGSPDRATEALVDAFVWEDSSVKRREIRSVILDDGDLCARIDSGTGVGEEPSGSEPSLPPGFSARKEGGRAVITAPADYRREVDILGRVTLRPSAKAAEQEVRRALSVQGVAWD